MCWSAVVEMQSLTTMRKYMFFSPTDPGSKQQEKDVAVCVNFSTHFTFYFSRKASCFGLTKSTKIKK